MQQEIILSAKGRVRYIMKELGLYIHIPFCVKKCRYCDFLSAPADEKTRTIYIRRLKSEISACGRWLCGRQVRTVFIGGGTPSLLSGADIAGIMHSVRESFNTDILSEVTIECNPGTADKEKALVWKAAGINRVSVGLQSADNKSLRLLGRIHTWERFLESYDILRNAGFDNINIDLMSSLPGQSPAQWEDTLRKTAALGPEHISAYSLMIEEGTPFYDIYGSGTPEHLPGRGTPEHLPGSGTSEHLPGSISFAEGKVCADRTNEGRISRSAEDEYPPLPDEDTDRRMYAATREILSGFGYSRYEISNYARKGYECRHNIGYWRRADYLGLGLGASSMIDNVRFKNTDDMDRYMDDAYIRECGPYRELDRCRDDRAFGGLRGTVSLSVDDKSCSGPQSGAVSGDDKSCSGPQNAAISGDDKSCSGLQGAPASGYDKDLSGPHGQDALSGAKNGPLSARAGYPCAYEEMELLDIPSQMEEFMFLGLRMTDGVTFKDFEDCFGVTMQSVYGGVIESMCSLKMIEASKTGIRLTARGVDVSNTVLSGFIL